MSKTKGKYDIKLLQSVSNFYQNKSNKIEDNDNILIKYLNNKEIIRDSKNNYLFLSKFINELLKVIENCNDIILPFIESTYDLIEIYINTDNKIQKEIWEKIFIKLIDNSFFERECLIPIYSYFTELYSNAGNISKSIDKEMSKFKKVIDLWKWIYLNCQNKIKTNTLFSSFCFLGSGLDILLPLQFPNELCLNIRINFITENFLEYVRPNDYFIKTTNYCIEYNHLIKVFHTKNLKYIDFQFKLENSNKVLWFIINRDENAQMIPLNEINPKVTILNNFYGQIKDITIYFYDHSKEKEINSKTIYPYPLKDNKGIIFYSNYKVIDKIKTSSEYFNADIYNNNKKNNPFNDDYKFNLTIKVQNFNLFRVNYINCKETGFNVINYFGGIKQFLPFLKIINDIYNNKNIVLIDNIDKKEILIDFAKNILQVLFKYVSNDTNGRLKQLEKYWTFFIYIINKIEPFKHVKNKIDMNIFKQNRTYLEGDNIFTKIIIRFLIYINSRDINDDKLLKDLIIDNYFKEKGKANSNLSLFWKTNNQLYRHIMKQLFIYHRLWSKQYLFFNDIKNCYKIYNKKETKLQIKYKRLNYYTSNFQQPLIYPILEINNFYPNFKKFKYEFLYKNPKEKLLNYDFSLNKHKNIINEEFIKNYLDNDNNDINNVYKCCLVKKMYHVKGRIGWIFDNNENNNKFSFYFLSDLSFKKETCNRKNNSDLCHGSIFPSLEKENNRLIYIPREKIAFAIIRIYYHRISALEIFTIDNKSYYFNFREEIVISDENINNNIFKILNFYFKPINQSKNILGWYNPDFEKVYFPMFSENIDIWKEKHTYSNFDKLMIINLFSNRSLHDLNQYPVFPMFYNAIDLKRVMDKPIGFQEINKESISRTQLIKDSYYTEKDFNEGNDTEEISYFSIIFSNITFVCNYLIRVYPYSYISIEIQGDRFDLPERLFFSINSTWHNTLSQRSDLRELIPEMFYFPPLFYNMNNIELNKLNDGSNIDNIFINKRNENKNEKYNFLKNMKNNLENEEKLNQWIDLIFGINKEFDENNERYYSSNNNVEFISKPKVINDDLILQSCDFGVLPYKLFSEKFPSQNKIQKDIESEIIKYNYNQFLNDYIYCLYDEKISFICKGEKGINSKYLDLINKTKNEFKIFGKIVNWHFFKSNNNKIDNIYYLFTGDVFGNLSVYERKRKNDFPKLSNINEDFEVSNPEKIFCDNIYCQNYILLNQLNDHTKEIIYIDYNPRLNMLADYSLDGFINIYMMPSLKLIRAIQTKDYKIGGKINKIALVSSPFPILCVANDKMVFIFDINGEFIKSYSVNEGIKVEFCVDKNCGRVNDYIIYNQNGKPNLINIL